MAKTKVANWKEAKIGDTISINLKTRVELNNGTLCRFNYSNINEKYPPLIELYLIAKTEIKKGVISGCGSLKKGNQIEIIDVVVCGTNDDKKFIVNSCRYL